MPITTSLSKQIDALVSDLSSSDAATREAAVARLSVIGARSVDRLVAAVGSKSPVTSRAAALRALEAIGDPRAIAAALTALDDAAPEVAGTAVDLLRGFVRGAHGVEVVDKLTITALDTNRPEALRIATIRALGDLGKTTTAPLFKTLAGDKSEAIRREVERSRRSTSKDGNPPVSNQEPSGTDDPEALKRQIAENGSTVPLSFLASAVERGREKMAADRRASAAWAAVRGAAHLALAERGSKLALYDLREWLESGGAELPLDALSALSVAGDASALEAIAAAYAKSAAGWSRDRLMEAFRTIVAREKLTRRHAVMKKIEKRWPAILEG